MIIPKEKPYMDGLNSYYLATGNFVEHLQGEIGTGCIYFKASTREILIYFDEMDMLGGVIQDTGKNAEVVPSMQPIFDALKERNYLVKVFHLDPHAIFFWAQMPPYKRAKNDIESTEMSLPQLVNQVEQKKASCFVDVKHNGTTLNGILFFHQGNFMGASYSWGAGGMNPSKKEFDNFLKASEEKKGVFTVGNFEESKKVTKEKVVEKEKETTEKKKPELAPEDQVFITNLPTVLEEFLGLYINIVKKKAHVDPVSLMQQRIIVRGDDYPFLDPFNPPFEFTHGDFIFTGTDNAFGENTAKAIIECSWDVVKELRLEKKFRTALTDWNYKSDLEGRGYKVVV